MTKKQLKCAIGDTVAANGRLYIVAEILDYGYDLGEKSKVSAKRNYSIAGHPIMPDNGQVLYRTTVFLDTHWRHP